MQGWGVFHLGSSQEPSSAARDKEAAARTLLISGLQLLKPHEISHCQPALHRQAGRLHRGVQDYDWGALAGRGGKWGLDSKPRVMVVSLLPLSSRALMRAALSQGSELGLATLPSESGPVPAGVALNSPQGGRLLWLKGRFIVNIRDTWLYPLKSSGSSRPSLVSHPRPPLPPVFLTLFIQGQTEASWAELPLLSLAVETWLRY